MSKCFFNMNSINETQIQSTNDASSVSKCSAVTKNYFVDDFIEEFVIKKKSRAPLIHLGYYTRAAILSKLINDFIAFLNLEKVLKFQIISLGAGFDTTYWRLSQANLLHKSVFVEIDFPNVILRKIELINQSQKLTSFISGPNHWEVSGRIKKLNANYYLLEADLSDVYLIEKLFNEIKIDYDIPTLFLSECVITYMKEFDSRKLIDWISKKFKNGSFINYEQIHPDDGFGQVMLRHFDKLQSSLFSVAKYPDSEFLSKFRKLSEDEKKYKAFNDSTDEEQMGFENSHCVSEWEALIWLIPEEERKRVLSLELFDEFEEFHLKCAHYVVSISGNGVSSHWINSVSSVKKNFLNDTINRPCLEGFVLDCELELFRHFSCITNGSIFVFGGCNRQGRSSKIYKIGYADGLNIKSLQNIDQNIRLDMAYGSASYFELNKVPFVCLYGGRTSPDKVWKNGSLVICEISDDGLSERLVISEGNPVSRYRTTMVSLNADESEAHCWIFGGRTANLNRPLSDFWQLTVKYYDKQKLTAEWTQIEKKGSSWPRSRMSHSFTACPERSELFIIGGLTMDSAAALNDVWKWSCSSESWQQVQLAGQLLPRYGHTSHLKDNVIYLVGGVNTLAGLQPGLARIDLKNLTVTEYTISSHAPEPTLLFNHTGEIIGEGDDAEICIIGGGGNCFSFGTHINRCALGVKLRQINQAR